EDIASFPAPFLLFASHVGSLTLEDRTKNVLREIRLRSNGDRIALEDGEDASVWRVFQTVYTPSPAARRDTGEFAARDSLPVSWAVKLQGKQERGLFYAFFATHYYTMLCGILKAPWKTQEDRQNLLEGPLNEELIDVAARLIVSNLKNLVEPS